MPALVKNLDPVNLAGQPEAEALKLAELPSGNVAPSPAPQVSATTKDAPSAR